MTSIAGLNNFNNLLYNTKKIAIANVLEHRAGRVPLDLSYKTPARPDELLTSSISHINGTYGDLKYKPIVLHSRPYFGYDASLHLMTQLFLMLLDINILMFQVL